MRLVNDNKINKISKQAKRLLCLVFMLSAGTAVAGGGNTKSDDGGETAIPISAKNDFYQYMNGGWVASSASFSSTSAGSTVKRCIENPKNQDSNVVKLYNSLTNIRADGARTKSKAIIMAKIKEVDDNLKEKGNLPKVITDLNMIGVNPLMVIQVKPTADVSAKLSKDVNQWINNAILMPPPEEEEPMEYTPDNVRKFYNFASIPLPTDDEITKIIRLENLLKQLVGINRDTTYKVYTPEEFISLIKRLPGTNSEEEINYDFINYFNMNHIPSTTFRVSNIQYFALLNGVLKGLTLPSLKNYLKFKILQEYAWTIKPSKEEYNEDAKIIFVIHMLNNEVLKVCFLDKDLTQEKDRANLVSNSIKDAYKSLIDSQYNLKQRTKDNLKKKLEALRVTFGYSASDILDNYSKLQLFSDSLANNLMSINELKYDYMLKRTNKSACIKDFDLLQVKPSASHCRDFDLITISPVLLKEPFLEDIPEDSHAGIGFTIAHEMGHALDAPELWEDDIDLFTEAHKILKKQYPGLISTREPWADVLGLSVAFRAYEAGLKKKGETKDEKLYDQYIRDFYIEFTRINGREFNQSGSNEYPPIKDRINNALKFQDEFLKVFDIQPNNKMYLVPVDRAKAL